MTVYADTRFQNRRRRLASTLAGQRIDAMLVTHLTHVRFLSGFSGSNGAVLVKKDLTALISTDGRYTTQVGEEASDLELISARNCGSALLETVDGPRRVGYEADYVTVSELESLQKACPEGITLVPVTGVIEEIRLVKDEVSLDHLRHVARIAVVAWEELLEAGELRAGRRENEVAADLEYRMRKHGSEHTSFDTIVASGLNSAKPHHGADDTEIQDGDIVTVDFGAHLLGFNSDITRSVIVGHTTDFTKEIYDVVLRAQLAGIDAATPGTALVDVDRACRDIIDDAGYGEYFVHSTGHGVGLDVHEAPYASTGGKGVLEPGMTLTIEPGIYVPGKGGVRIEDSLIIRAGAPEIITDTPKELRLV